MEEASIKVEKTNFVINNVARSGVRVGVGNLIIEAVDLDIADQWDFMELAGSQIDNQAWVNVALLAASVISINGTPQPSALKTRETIRSILRRLGSEGLEALRVAFGEDPADVKGHEMLDEAIAAGN